MKNHKIFFTLLITTSKSENDFLIVSLKPSILFGKLTLFTTQFNEIKLCI